MRENDDVEANNASAKNLKRNIDLFHLLIELYLENMKLIIDLVLLCEY